MRDKFCAENVRVWSCSVVQNQTKMKGSVRQTVVIAHLNILFVHIV